ncbi:MAG: M1 family metallopeptidase [Nannocystaceae bacterium]|nr:M1 family metallopeptidase [Nannocystaceae bacterium]
MTSCPRRMRVPAWLLPLALACGPRIPPAPAPVPEPTSPLREPARVGPIPADAKVQQWTLRARLDAATHRIEGHATLQWRNTSTVAVRTMPLHLYMNAFRAEDTAWMAEGRGRHRGNAPHSAGGWGYVDVTAIHRVEPAPERKAVALQYRELPEPSLMELDLGDAIAPGEGVELEIDFVTQLPEVFARTGYAGEFHMVGQWYPKPGVLHRDGSWHTHAFTYHSEFYADFGDYEVELDVPANMVVGATGVLHETVRDGDRKRLQYRAQMVHDFAWTADPGFLEYTAEHEGIRIRQLVHPEHAFSVDAHLQAQIAALDSMQGRYGSYPWSTITIVHPPSGAEGAAGMEYPTLFTTSPVREIPGPLRALGLRERVSGVFTTVHEFGHQYFQGLLASDEAAAPWLDEGMNTTSNVLVVEDGADDDGWVVRVGPHALFADDFVRMAQQGIGTLQAIDQPAEAFSPVVGGYGGTVYRRTAALMLTLRNLVGDAAFDRALHEYAIAWRFRHPTGADLEQALVDGIGERVTLGAADPADPATGTVELDVRALLEAGLRGTGEVDYRVHAIVNRSAMGHAGWHRNAEGVLVGGEAPTEPGADEAVVVLHRAGEMVVPVEVEIRFADDTTVRRIWSGTRRTHTLQFDKHVRSVRLDPEGKLLLEAVRLDNHRFAPGEDFDDGLSQPLGQAAETAALLVLTGVGP